MGNADDDVSVRNDSTHAAGNVIQTGKVVGDLNVNVQQLPRPVARVPKELPLDVADFSGREPELALLNELLTRDPNGRAIVISAVSGTAGVGKTALAVHWAHQIRDDFPDGDLYIDLQGYDPNQPVSAEDALAALLRSLGGSTVPIPPTLAERARRFRTLVANRRMLIVLDNAHTAEQVRPLLPGAGSAFVIVTSRDKLTGLVVKDSARRVHLDLRAARARREASLANRREHHRVPAGRAARNRGGALVGLGEAVPDGSAAFHCVVALGQVELDAPHAPGVDVDLPGERRLLPRSAVDRDFNLAGAFFAHEAHG